MAHKKIFKKVPFVAQPVTEFPVEIYFKFYLEGRRIDATNLSYMAKMIEDCLVDKGILPNDSPRYVQRVIMESYKIKTKENYCEIQIKPLNALLSTS